MADNNNPWYSNLAPTDWFTGPAIASGALRAAYPFIRAVAPKVLGGAALPLSFIADAKPANGGEANFYNKDGSLNLKNPAFKLDMSQFLPPGYKGPEPFEANYPPSAPVMPSAPGASPAAASASPSPSPGLPSPAAPAGAPGGGGLPWVNPDTRRFPSFYNGPGSMSFGATEQAPGGGIGGLMNLFKGGTDASSAVQNGGDKPFWNLMRAFTNNGQSFAPNFFASNAWYNK